MNGQKDDKKPVHSKNSDPFNKTQPVNELLTQFNFGSVGTKEEKKTASVEFNKTQPVPRQIIEPSPPPVSKHEPQI